MTTAQAKAKLLDAAQAWHASTELSGKRATSADRELRRAVCHFPEGEDLAEKALSRGGARTTHNPGVKS